jgi:hypothetical protein
MVFQPPIGQNETHAVAKDLQYVEPLAGLVKAFGGRGQVQRHCPALSLLLEAAPAYCPALGAQVDAGDRQEVERDIALPSVMALSMNDRHR